MLQNFLNPQSIVNLLRNNADFKKIAINFFNSEDAKQFITNDLGLDYQSLKENLILAYTNTKKSNVGLKRQQELEQSQKLQIYKELANTLITDDGLSIYSAIILAAGFVGIEQNKVVEYLKSKGYTATKQKIENYYKNNEGFLKSLFKKKNKIIPGWNDAIESSDLEIFKNDENNEKLTEIPDIPIEQELGIKE